MEDPNEIDVLKAKLERRERDIVNIRKRLDEVLDQNDEYLVQIRNFQEYILKLHLYIN